MGAIDGGALFGKALVNEGVEKAFVLSGWAYHADLLWDARGGD